MAMGKYKFGHHSESDMAKPEEIISNEEVIRVHGHAYFGPMTPRQVVNDGVWKYAIGYSSGHTQWEILRGHGLITGARRGRHGQKASLTEKGKRYARALYGAGIWLKLKEG